MLSLVFSGGNKPQKMKIFKNDKYPKKSKNLAGQPEAFSVDVISVDVDGMSNIAYWNYDLKKWGFLADTLSDPYEDGELIDFVWMYIPTELCVGK